MGLLIVVLVVAAVLSFEVLAWFFGSDSRDGFAEAAHPR